MRTHISRTGCEHHYSTNLSTENPLPIAQPSHDIRERGFWSAAQDAYFDIMVFHTNAPSNSSGSISAAYKKHEDIKKRAYGQRVRDVEHGIFTPLVFSTTGGMGQEATTFYKRLADMLA